MPIPNPWLPKRWAVMLAFSGLVSGCSSSLDASAPKSTLGASGTAVAAREDSSRCENGPSLAELKTARLEVNISQRNNRTQWGFSAVVTAPDKGKKTYLAPQARATFNGQPLTRMTGLVKVGGKVLLDRDCGNIEFAFPGGPVQGPFDGGYGYDEGVVSGAPIPDAALRPGPSELVIEDGTDRWTLSIQDAVVGRTVTMTRPANGPLRRGEPAELRWSGTQDVLPSLAEVGSVILLSRGLSIRQPVPHARVEKIDGTLFRFTLPQDIPVEANGPVQLIFPYGSVRPNVSPCPVAGCKVHVDLNPGLVDAQLVP